MYNYKCKTTKSINLQPGSVHLEAIVSINSGSSTDSKQHLMIDIVVELVLKIRSKSV